MMKMSIFNRDKLQITQDAVIWRGVSYRTRYFLRRVYYYLHARPNLLKKAKYRCLYEESLNFQAEWIWIASNHEKDIDLYRHMIRAVADMSVRSNGKNGSELTRGALNEFLRYRQGVWGCVGRSCRSCKRSISNKDGLSE